MNAAPAPLRIGHRSDRVRLADSLRVGPGGWAADGRQSGSARLSAAAALSFCPFT